MIVNPKIETIAKKYGIDVKYLFSEILMREIIDNSTFEERTEKYGIAVSILTEEFISNGTLKIIPAFLSSNEDIDWICEYTELFENMGRKPFTRECTKRMKDIFQRFPDITKREVIEATKLYLKDFPYGSSYFRESHYFIQKGVGKKEILDLITWIDVLRNNNKKDKNRTDEARKLK